MKSMFLVNEKLSLIFAWSSSVYSSWSKVQSFIVFFFDSGNSIVTGGNSWCPCHRVWPFWTEITIMTAAHLTESCFWPQSFLLSQLFAKKNKILEPGPKSWVLKNRFHLLFLKTERWRSWTSATRLGPGGWEEGQEPVLRLGKSVNFSSNGISASK